MRQARFSSRAPQMSRKRILSSDSGHFPFRSVRDMEMFEIERNILARFVYKHEYVFRRIDILERVKVLIKALDEFASTRNVHLVAIVLTRIETASERFFQHLSMGLVLSISMTCIASLARLAEIFRQIPVQASSKSMEDDHGIPIARVS